MKLPIETKNPLFGKYLYPIAKKVMEEQQDIFWTAQEIKVSKDIQDYRQKMSPEQLQLVTLTLQLFVEIEQKVGEVWETIAAWFPHSEIEGACTQIAAMEKSVHAFFYQKMSDELNIDPEEIARNQQTVFVLKDKLEFLQSITSNLSKDKPLSLATVALIEQVLLFSNFAMLKSFQANGHNLIPNTITGVSFVVNDEQLHGVFASYLHNTYIEEASAGRRKFNLDDHHNNLIALVKEIIAHEDAVIDYLFNDIPSINDITSSQLKLFIRSRANKVLIDMKFSPYYTITDNPISNWFFQGANSIKMHDFFVTGTNSYSRGWSLDSFSRLPHLSEIPT